MFTKRADTDAAVDAAIEVLRRSAESGATLATHEQLSEVVGHSPPDSRYYQLVRRARDRFRDGGGPWTREVPGQGFRFLSPEESLTGEQNYRRRRARNQIRTGVKVAAAVDDTKLTDHQRQAKHHTLAAHARVQREMRDDERLMGMIMRPASEAPIRVIPPRS